MALITTSDGRQERIKFLKERIKADGAEVARLKQEIQDERYLAYYEEVISSPIDWQQMCWPTRTYAAPGSRGEREIFKCIVCREPIGCEDFWRGGRVGDGPDHPDVRVHERCIPEEVLEADSADL